MIWGATDASFGIERDVNFFGGGGEYARMVHLSLPAKS